MQAMDTGLLLVRHGESTWNADHRWAGQADPPLSEAGRRQATELAHRAGTSEFCCIVSSDLRRAAETADLIASGLQTSRVIDARLRERHCAWSGLTSDQIEATYPGQLDAWRSGELVDLPGESETWDAFRMRIEDALNEHIRRGPRVLVVAHAGVFRVIEAAYGAAHQRVENARGRWLQFDGDLVRSGDAW